MFHFLRELDPGGLLASVNFFHFTVEHLNLDPQPPGETKYNEAYI